MWMGISLTTSLLELVMFQSRLSGESNDKLGVVFSVWPLCCYFL